jgi:hypothetical protein
MRRNSAKTKRPAGTKSVVPTTAATASSALLAAAIQQQFMKSHNVKLTLSQKSTNSAANNARNRPNPSNSSASTPNQLTLSQSLGLEPLRAPKFNENEWEIIENLSQQRHYSEFPCTICTEDFRASPTVLLSCSHVFHAVCLRNFEKFSGQLSCPLCRAKNYQKKLINHAETAWRNTCAVKIQAIWSRFRARKAYLLLLESIVPVEEGKKRLFFMKKLEKTTNKLVELVENKETELDKLFAQFDLSISQSRQQIAAASVHFHHYESAEWAGIRAKAVERGEKECAFCMGTMELTGKEGRREKGVILLSCSHLFHEKCLAAYEKFISNTQENNNNNDRNLGNNHGNSEHNVGAGFADSDMLLSNNQCDYKCALCRSAYQKIPFSLA